MLPFYRYDSNYSAKQKTVNKLHYGKQKEESRHLSCFLEI